VSSFESIPAQVVQLQVLLEAALERIWQLEQENERRMHSSSRLRREQIATGRVSEFYYLPSWDSSNALPRPVPEHHWGQPIDVQAEFGPLLRQPFARCAGRPNEEQVDGSQAADLNDVRRRRGRSRPAFPAGRTLPQGMPCASARGQGEGS
jgi:hypothetical protein